MNKLYHHLNINIDIINELNKLFLDMNFMKKLSSREKQILDNYKGSITFDPNIIHYKDYYNRISDNAKFCTIEADKLTEYFIKMDINKNLEPLKSLKYSNPDNGINDYIKLILNYIIDRKDKAILKNINILDNIFNKGIKVKNKSFKIYRIMDKEINDNILKSYSSWSLIPLLQFCRNDTCHIYITKIPSNIKFVYLEIKPDNKDKDLIISNSFYHYEYEILLPRGLKFKEYKKETLIIPHIDYNYKYNTSANQTIILHHIKIIGIKKEEILKLNKNGMLLSFNN